MKEVDKFELEANRILRVLNRDVVSIPLERLSLAVAIVAGTLEGVYEAGEAAAALDSSPATVEPQVSTQRGLYPIKAIA